MGAECADNTAFHRSHPVLPCRGHQGRKTGRRQKVSCIYGARLAAHIHHHPCHARAIRPYGALPRSLLITDCRKKARRRAKSKNNNNWKMEEQSRAWWKFELGTKIGGRGGWNGWLEDFPSFLKESQFGADWIGPAGISLGVRCPLLRNQLDGKQDLQHPSTLLRSYSVFLCNNSIGFENILYKYSFQHLPLTSTL